MPRVLWKPALVAAVVILVTAVGGAVAKGAGGSQSPVRFAKIDPALYASDGAAGKFTPASLSNKQVTAVVQLGGAPVAVRDANAKKQGARLSGAQKNAIRQQLRAQQNALHGQLANAGARIVGQMQDAYNGIQVEIAQKNLAKLASLPNVVGIHSVPTFKPANVNGVPFVGAPTAWQNTGATGAGVKVASIDTGIDYTHADFGGAGTVAAWNYAFAHSTTDPATDPQLAAQFGPAAPRVKGGYDFVGNDYNANVAGSVPHPDKNPLDCYNHGTHTAGTLAGSGVTNTGATYTGPYNGSISTNPADWNVFPGVAPQADIYAYRVFGCAGSSNVVDLAINQAVADGMNVISMSLGSDFGGNDDPTSVAAQNAVNDGVSVVASAGNAGGNGYMVGSPSTDNGVLSVAAMDGTTPTFPGAHLVLSKGGGGPIDAINANNATITAGTYSLRVVPGTGEQVSTPTGSGIDSDSISVGCTVAEDEAANGGQPWPAGTILVVERGICARVHKAVNAQQAGAAGVIMVNNSSGLPPFEGPITSDPDNPGFNGTVTIPFLGVTGGSPPSASTNGQALLAGDGGTVTLSATTVPNTGYKTTTSFSSGGPRNPDSAPKPDVIAPGLSVSSAGIGTGSGPLVESGTSMACPMTAGIAALVKQVHPAWNGLQIKAAIMNTADRSLNTGYNVRRAGAGVVQAQKAVNSTVLATTADQLDSIAFGYVPGSGPYSTTKAITLTNYGSVDASYNLSVVTNGSQQGAVVGVSPSSVTVPHGSSVTVQVSLSISASAFAALLSDDTFSIGPGGVLTVRGDIVATKTAGDASAQNLAVPYLVVPRGLSNVTAGTPAAWTKSNSPAGKGFTSTLPVTNNGIHAGTADLYAWGIHDAHENGAPMDVRDVGVQVQPGANFGVADSDRGLVFLINTYGQATNQSVNEYDVLIDTNRDGQPDFAVVGIDLGAVLTGSNDGRFGSFTIDLSTGDIVDAFFADAPMNGSTIELPAIASEIGLTQKAAKPTTFRYWVNAFSNVPGGIVDTTGSALFDPFHPAVSSGVLNEDGTPIAVAAGGSASLPLSIDKSQQLLTPALGWLVASVDDANGAAQADEVAAPALK